MYSFIYMKKIIEEKRESTNYKNKGQLDKVSF